MKFEYCCMPLSDSVKVKPEPKKDIKPQNKSQSKANSRKPSNRRSPHKKDKNGIPAADVCPPETAESQAVAPSAVEAGDSEEPLQNSSYSPAQKRFQRTLSPADVLHVHSYAKGDYGEGEVQPKEEKKSEASDNEMEKDNRHFCKAVSAHTLVNEPQLSIAVQHPCSICAVLQQVAEVMPEDGELEIDLGQLPGHHPLIKDGMSDEGLLETKH